MSNHAGRSKRLFAGFLAAVMALSVAPVLGFTGVAGADEHLEARDPIGEGNFCEDVPMQEPFTDVHETDPSYEEIVCLVATEVTTGVTATTYEPNSFVTRRQMALFLTRVAAEADRLEIDDNINELPEPAANEFDDVEDEEQFIQDAISQIAQAEIAEGFEDGNYRPAAPVSRRQMAAFIDRLYEYLTGEALPDAAADNFEDDNEDSAEAQASTNAVAEAGIFIGNEDGTFRPAQEITRRQMANVLTRTFEVLFENGEIEQWHDDEAAEPFAVAADAGDVTITAGDNVVVTFTGDTDQIESITAAGGCIEDGAVELAEDDTVTVATLADAAGDCEIVLTVTFADDTTQDVVVLVTFEAPAGDYEGGQAVAIDDDELLADFAEQSVFFTYGVEDLDEFTINGQDATAAEFRAAVEATLAQDAEHALAVVYDTEGAGSVFVLTTEADMTAPEATVTTTDNMTFVFAFDEDIDCDSYVEAEDITVDVDNEVIVSSACDADADTITVVFDDPLDAVDEDSVTLVAGSILDLVGNAGPSDDVTIVGTNGAV